MERPYYSDIGYEPLLFYVIFGVGGSDLAVSREKHKVNGIPEGLEIYTVKRPDDDEYMNAMLGGSIAGILMRSEPELYNAALASDVWTVLRGEITNDSTLDYMQDTIGIVQALAEQGAAAILDLQTFSLFSADEWNDTYFAREFDPYAHADILVSETDNGVWLHTRGMRKFGRPDISLENVPTDCSETALQLVNQMIYYAVMGAFYYQDSKFNIPNGVNYIVHPTFVGDMECPDFNNCYYRIHWEECTVAEE